MAARTGQDTLVLPNAVAVRERAFLRRHAWVVPVLRAASDGVLVALAFVIAYWMRYSLEIGGDVLPGFAQPFDFFTGKVALLVAVTILIFQLRGLYRLPRWTTFLDEATLITSGATTGMAIVILYSFLQQFYPSRLIFIYAWLVTIVLLLAKRVAARSMRGFFWRRGIGVDHVLVVGAGTAAQRYMQTVLSRPQVGYRLVGFVNDVPADESWAIATEHRVVRPAYLGNLDDIERLVHEDQIDEIVIALPPTAHHQVAPIIDQCRATGVVFTIVPDLVELAIDQVNTYEVGGLPLIGLKESQIRGWNYVVKRGMDLLIASAVLAVSAVPMLIFAIAIKLDSPGPILFPQERVGKNGERFILYKFRTMHRDAEKQKAELQAAFNVGDLLFKIKDDPRRTRVGRVLRRASLDELPQFFNILFGEMSVVGPRPQVPAEVANYDDWHHRRLLVTPGLTGIWQVSGRSDLTFDEMVKLDLYYAENWSPWLDIKIMLRTIPAVLLGRGAY